MAFFWRVCSLLFLPACPPFFSPDGQIIYTPANGALLAAIEPQQQVLLSIQEPCFNPVFFAVVREREGRKVRNRKQKQKWRGRKKVGKERRKGDERN